jgi:hypothetical protein
MAVEKIRFGKTPKHVANYILNSTKNAHHPYSDYIQQVQMHQHEHHPQLHQQQQPAVNFNGLIPQQRYTNAIQHNQNVENLIKRLISYVDVTVQEYMASQTTATTTQKPEKQYSYYNHHVNAQYTSHYYAQNLIEKLRFKVLNVLNEYLYDDNTGLFDNDYEQFDFDTTFNSFYASNSNSSNHGLGTAQLNETLITAYLYLFVPDSELVCSNKTNFQMNPMSKTLKSAELLQFTLNRIYLNNLDDCNRVVKILHFILLLLVQNMSAINGPGMNSTLNMHNSDTSLTVATSTISDIDTNTISPASFSSSTVSLNTCLMGSQDSKLQAFVASLIGMKSRNKLTKNKILLSLDVFLEF